MNTTGLLVVYAKCVHAVDEGAWDEWEDDVHLPAVCAPDGPWAATRFELTARPHPGMPGVSRSDSITVLLVPSVMPTRVVCFLLVTFCPWATQKMRRVRP